MKITTKLSESEYLSATLSILFNRTAILFFIIMIGGISVFNIATSVVKSQALIPTLLPPVIILTLFGIIFYSSLKKGYKNNPRMQETITYDFKEDSFLITGQSFSSELTWNKIPKVSVTKKFLLIWQTKSMANVIPKRDITPEHLRYLKSVLTKHGISNNL